MKHSPAWGMSSYTVDGGRQDTDAFSGTLRSQAARSTANHWQVAGQRAHSWRADTRHVGRDGCTNAKYMIEGTVELTQNIYIEGTVALTQNTHIYNSEWDHISLHSHHKGTTTASFTMNITGTWTQHANHRHRVMN